MIARAVWQKINGPVERVSRRNLEKCAGQTARRGGNSIKIRFLGTAAYEGVPALFCECDTCKKSLAAGGRNLRSRLQALVNDDLLLDFPPDTLWHTRRFGLDWTKIKTCLITHSHSDHFYPEDIQQLEPVYSHGDFFLHFYAGESGYRKLREMLNFAGAEKRIALSEVRGGDAFTAGGYDVLALPANHDPRSSPVFYAIGRDGKRLLYAHDTGVFPDSVWEILGGGPRFDLVSFDCTAGLGKWGDWREGHMTIRPALEMLQKMREAGLADCATVAVINHFSHNCGSTHDELAEAAREYGVTVAYDGFEVEF